MRGSDLIAAERERQVIEEDWSNSHDEGEHPDGELAAAARCYALDPILKEEDESPRDWPWAEKWWKPKDQISDLVRAGALIAAEIDRIQRVWVEPPDPNQARDGEE